MTLLLPAVMLFIVIVLIVLASFLFIPAVCFQILSPNTKTHEKANKGNATKDAKCNSFTVGVDMGGE